MSNSKFDIYLYQYLESEGIIEAEKKPDTKSMTTEELETVMKSWVESQRGE